MKQTGFVRGQLSLYEQQSEQWQQKAGDAERRKELEEIIALGNFVFTRITHVDEEWSREIEALHQVPDEADAQAVWSLYANWAKKTEANLKVAEEIERKGYRVEGVAEYRKAYEAARLVTSISIDRFRLSLRHQSEGQLRSLGDVRDELRRRADARS